MGKSRVQYILTWVALGVLLCSALLLVALSWNRILAPASAPSVLVMLWFFISASGIYLFMLAVKKAHRQWIDEERRSQESNDEKLQRARHRKDPTKESQELDFPSAARKLIRRVNEDEPLEEAGKGLLKNLARELEIMSGLFYLRKKGRFEVAASFAVSSSNGPVPFKEGEGLNGQVAKNQQVMVLTNLPEEYLEVYSGLGGAKPGYVALVPFIHKNKTIALLECSGYKYDPHDIENLFRILARDLMEKLSPTL
jgi:hypothetical protein